MMSKEPDQITQPIFDTVSQHSAVVSSIDYTAEMNAAPPVAEVAPDFPFTYQQWANARRDDRRHLMFFKELEKNGIKNLAASTMI